MNQGEDPGAANGAPPAVAAGAFAPVLGTLLPVSGPAGGTTTVTLFGAFFTGVTAVRFGTTEALDHIVRSSTRITAVAPPGAGLVPVTVTNSHGSSGQYVPYLYTGVPAPTVLTGVAPDHCPVAGGTHVTLTGGGFSRVTGVRFGAVAALAHTVDSPTRITAVCPPQPAGSVAVTVTTPTGTVGGVRCHYLDPPFLSALTPADGPESGGVTVTLTGSCLTTATTVRFGTADAAGHTVDSSTQLTATAPPGTGAVPVTVTTAGGTSNFLPFRHVPAPALHAATPGSGPATGGTVVTLTGSALATVSAVRFGSDAAAHTVESDTSVVALVPAGAAGEVPVTVTTAGGTSRTVTYRRVAPPEL
ncbi:IPT/TIG domain-containing protein [Streptomyces sp. ACA25]|uniref:IPT/TIG domain-containing protein n=1 Tax=Streptomyces sp. ACA25 TaxID=3022596 RepID=UPI002307D77D|nr:IPT/TIG domain-containing protein [Streptomyces sp. ACA25]MDB1087874.1 IPT/TIG domain-containing protein [Streptomyces sp. ACA25]